MVAVDLNAVRSAAVAAVGQAIDQRAAAAVAACSPAELAVVLDTLAELANRGQPGAQTALDRTAAAVTAAGRGEELRAMVERAGAAYAALAAVPGARVDPTDRRPAARDRAAALAADVAAVPAVQSS